MSYTYKFIFEIGNPKQYLELRIFIVHIVQLLLNINKYIINIDEKMIKTKAPFR